LLVLVRGELARASTKGRCMIHGTRRDHLLEPQDGRCIYGATQERREGTGTAGPEPMPRALMTGRRISLAKGGSINIDSIIIWLYLAYFSFESLVCRLRLPREVGCIHGSSTRRRAMRSGTARASRGRTKVCLSPTG
jgi:hypothetical protein